MSALPADTRETAEETAAAARVAQAHVDTDNAAPLATKTRGAFEAVSFSAIGLEMGVAVIIGLLFGRWLDGKAGTDPWLMILFICFGFAAGLRAVMVAMKKADRAAERNEAIASAKQRARQAVAP
jgi:ATP synthase protein I